MPDFLLGLGVTITSYGGDGTSPTPPPATRVLTEDGDYVITEDGNLVVQE